MSIVTKEGHLLVIADVEASATKESLSSIPPVLEGGQKSQDVSTNGSLRDVFCLTLPASTILFAITIYAPLVDRLKVDYNATTVEYNLNITFALVGLALAPLVLDPFLKSFGGKRAVLASWLLFIIFSIGSAFVNNLGGLVVLRFFAFLFSGPTMSLFQASLIYLPRTKYQHFIFSLATASCLLGLSLGLVFGGLIEGHARGNARNWSRYLVPILSFVVILPFAIFGNLPQVAASGRDGASNGVIKSAKSNYRSTLTQFITFNSKEWIVIASTLYLSQVYFFFFVTLGAFPYAFGRTRGYTTSEVALSFLSLVVGILFSILLPLATKGQRAFTPFQTKGAQSTTAESSLRDLLFCSLLLPIGIFLFAWTASMPNVHWIASMIGIIIFAFGSNITLTYLNVYLINIYSAEHAQIALMCPMVSQALTASIAPLLTLFMIHNVTFGGSLSVLAGVLTGLTITPFALWRYGAKLRSEGSIYHQVRQRFTH